MEERTGGLTGEGGIRLFYRIWTGEGPARGLLLVVPGANEHSGRYRHVAEYLTRRGLDVAALDQRGHGRSGGARCHVDRFPQYLADLRRFVQQVGMGGRARRPVLLGHSLGGLVAFSYAVAHPEDLSAVVLSSPWFELKMKLAAWERALAPVLSRLLPRLQLPAHIPPQDLSRDPEVVRAYREDPLVGTTATPRWFVECSRAARRARGERAGQLKVPVLFLQAGDDRVVDAQAARAVYDAVDHPRKAWRLYPGRFHEILNDPGHEAALEDVVQWLDAQGLLEGRRAPRA